LTSIDIEPLLHRPPVASHDFIRARIAFHASRGLSLCAGGT
jgi:hypothetical protein